MATAPSMTSAYSAVVWPAAPAQRIRAATTSDETTEHVTSSGRVGNEARRLEAREPGRETRNHREQHERGQDEEDEGEEEAHGDTASMRFGTSPERGALLGGEPAERGPDRRAEPIGGEQRVDERPEARRARVRRRRARRRSSRRARTLPARTRTDAATTGGRPAGRDLDCEVRRAARADRHAEQIESRWAARARARRRHADSRRRRPERTDDAPRPDRSPRARDLRTCAARDQTARRGRARPPCAGDAEPFRAAPPGAHAQRAAPRRVLPNAMPSSARGMRQHLRLRPHDAADPHGREPLEREPERPGTRDRRRCRRGR